MAAAADKKHYVLVSSDGQSFRVSPSVVKIFKALDTLIERENYRLRYLVILRSVEVIESAHFLFLR